MAVCRVVPVGRYIAGNSGLNIPALRIERGAAVVCYAVFGCALCRVCCYDSTHATV